MYLFLNMGNDGGEGTVKIKIDQALGAFSFYFFCIYVY